MDILPRFFLALPFALLGQSVATYLTTRWGGRLFGSTGNTALMEMVLTWAVITILLALAGMAVASQYGAETQSAARRWIMSLIATVLASALIFWLATAVFGG